MTTLHSFREPLGTPVNQLRGRLSNTATASVVVIDDDGSLRELIHQRLRRSGMFEVVGEADDGPSGIEEAARHQPNVILLDLWMPGMDGREALPTIVRDCPSSMVVVLSALSAADETDATKALGAFAYIQKDGLARLPDELAYYLDHFQQVLDGVDAVIPCLPPLCLSAAQ